MLATLGGPDVTILSDELNHASIVDGARLARADVRVYGHVDLDQLGKLLVDVDAAGRGPALVVTDSVFSMDGDVVDVAALVDVCAGHDALVVVDEAHAVLGPRVDLSAATDRGVTVLRVGTLSKALGSLGGFVAGPRRYVDLLRNRARPFIFTTAPTPADIAAALAAVRVVRSAEGVTWWRACEPTSTGCAPGIPTPIVPVVLGDEAAALAGADALLTHGPARSRPSGRPPCRSGRRACASPCPPPTPTSRSSGWSRPWRTLGRQGAVDRPERLVLVVGTGTEVGKTWVACRLRQGAATAGPHRRRPQAGAVVRRGRRPQRHRRRPAGPRHRRPPRGRVPPAPLVPGGDGAADGGRGAGPAPVHRRRPGRGARVADGGRASGSWRPPEGVRSPLAADGDGVALAAALRPDRVVLVADAGLGTINGVRLSMAALAPWPVTVVLNRFDPGDDLHVRNLEWLAGVDGLDVVTDAEDLVSPIVGWPS